MDGTDSHSVLARTGSSVTLHQRVALPRTLTEETRMHLGIYEFSGNPDELVPADAQAAVNEPAITKAIVFRGSMGISLTI